MIRTIATVSVLSAVFVAATPLAHAELPMGLKCEKGIKIVGAEIGAEGKYTVQKGMVKDEHSAILDLKTAKAVDGCHFTGITPGQLVIVRYSGEQIGDNEVQCIDQNNGNAPVTFPKSIYTVRYSRVSQWMLMPYCPDGKSPVPGFPCSKKNTQSERSTEYQDTILKWKDKKGNDSKDKDKLHLVDLRFDPAYKNSIPSNAKLFCALINRDGNVIIAGTAQYPEVAADAPKESDARTRSREAKPDPKAEAAAKEKAEQADEAE